MKKRRLRIGWSRYSDSEFLTFSKSVLIKMTDNDNFPTPQPDLEAVGADINAFDTALANSKDGGKEQTSIKNQQRAALDATLKELASYVELVADDDVAKLQSSGFELTKIPEPIGPLGPGENFQVNVAGKGALEFSVDKRDGVKAYQFEYKKAGDESWIIESSTARKVLVQDLERGKEYVGRVLLIGASKIREYSQEVTAFVA